MKTKEIELRHIYLVKVSNQLVPVEICGTQNLYTRSGHISSRAKFIGINLKTKREIQFTAARCRRELNEESVKLYLQ